MSPKSAFDSLAIAYDQSFTDSIIGKLQRNQVWHHLQKVILNKAKLKILEINCGTGTDAIKMAAEGHQVIATDISIEMINVAKKKAVLNQWNKPVFIQCSFKELSAYFEPNEFDLIFSNFAGLNCIDKQALAELNKTFEELLKPNGKLIMVMLGKFCLIENLYFLSSLKFALINRRLKPALAKLNENHYQQTWYYTGAEIKAVFSNFRFNKQRPIGLFIPPSYLENKFSKNKRIIQFTIWLEQLLKHGACLANWADHIYLEFNKKL